MRVEVVVEDRLVGQREALAGAADALDKSAASRVAFTPAANFRWTAVDADDCRKEVRNSSGVFVTGIEADRRASSAPTALHALDEAIGEQLLG